MEIMTDGALWGFGRSAGGRGGSVGKPGLAGSGSRWVVFR